MLDLKTNLWRDVGERHELALLKQEHVCSHQMNAKIHHMIHQKTNESPN